MLVMIERTPVIPLSEYENLMCAKHEGQHDLGQRLSFVATGKAFEDGDVRASSSRYGIPKLNPLADEVSRSQHAVHSSCSCHLLI